MKATIKTLLIFAICATVFHSCREEEEGNELHIEFAKDSSYVYSDTTLPGGSQITIGVDAETEKPNDPIIRFIVSESKNSLAANTIYLDTTEQTIFSYSNIYTIDTVSGTTHKYTFTIFNRDGLSKETSLTVTVL